MSRDGKRDGKPPKEAQANRYGTIRHTDIGRTEREGNGDHQDGGSCARGAGRASRGAQAPRRERDREKVRHQPLHRVPHPQNAGSKRLGLPVRRRPLYHGAKDQLRDGKRQSLPRAQGSCCLHHGALHRGVRAGDEPDRARGRSLLYSPAIAHKEICGLYSTALFRPAVLRLRRRQNPAFGAAGEFGGADHQLLRDGSADETHDHEPGCVLAGTAQGRKDRIRV